MSSPHLTASVSGRVNTVMGIVVIALFGGFLVTVAFWLLLFENREDWWFFSVSLLVLALMPIIGGISYLRSGRVERRRYRTYLATLTPEELSRVRTRAGRKAAEAGVAKAWNAEIDATRPPMSATSHALLISDTVGEVEWMKQDLARLRAQHPAATTAELAAAEKLLTGYSLELSRLQSETPAQTVKRYG